MPKIDTTSAEVYELIKSDIFANEFRPNDRLTEVSLSQRYGVSRTPVRHALIKLDYDGYVYTIPHIGTFVRNISTKEIVDIFNVRAVLEGVAARTVAEDGISEKEAELLRELCEQIDCMHRERRLDEAGEIDIKLHDRICELANNQYIIDFRDKSRNQMKWFLSASNRRRMFLSESDSFLYMENPHNKILKAIEEGDPVRAEAAARLHVEEGKQYFLDKCFGNGKK